MNRLETKSFEGEEVSLVENTEEKWHGVLDEESGDCETFDTKEAAVEMYESITNRKTLFKAFGWEE